MRSEPSIAEGRGRSGLGQVERRISEWQPKGSHGAESHPNGLISGSNSGASSTASPTSVLLGIIGGKLTQVVNYLQWSFDKEPVCATAGIADYCHPKFYGGLPNQLFLNKGNGKFEDITESSGIRQHVGKGMSGVMADYDRRWPARSFLCLATKPSICYFTTKAMASSMKPHSNLALRQRRTESSFPGMGADFRDIDNDRLPDIGFAALNGETFPLFRNMGGGNFEDVTTSTGIRALSLPLAGFSLAMYDFDNDGWKDIFVTCGQVEALIHEGNPVSQPNAVFHNPGKQGRWTAATTLAGLGALPPARHRGAAFGDLNGDGRVDTVVTALNADTEIWMNTSANDNNWLELSLEGTKSNRDGIGARIKLVSKAGVQYNHVTTSVGYASSSAGPVHFGLGAATKADLIEIRWPSGVLQQLTNVDADQIFKITEPH